MNSAAPTGLLLHVNGAAHHVPAAATAPLLMVLRNDLGLNGPKYGCGLGQCGACTVLVDGIAVRACCLPAGSVVGRSIVTLEGLGTEAALHPVQRAFIAEAAAQCGYCLNGMIMGVVALLNRNPRPDEAAIRAALRHNLCRCGAHVEILRAARRSVREMAA